MDIAKLLDLCDAYDRLPADVKDDLGRVVDDGLSDEGGDISYLGAASLDAIASFAGAAQNAGVADAHLLLQAALDARMVIK